jgi:hypothetical protein
MLEEAEKCGSCHVYCICHFSRYISLTLVESLSKESILNAFKIHALRYGEYQQIEPDFGTNFSSARKTLQDGDFISEDDVKKITKTLKVKASTLSRECQRRRGSKDQLREQTH